MDRRQLLRAAAGTGLTLAASPLLAADAPHKYRVALVGAGWWGGNILRVAMESGQSRVVALCDVDTRQLDRMGALVKQVSGETPARYGDYRTMLEREKPEIVIVATPDHWHPLITIAAVKAGAHVWVEKPISHTIAEGRAMVKAARAADRVVQVGLHRRVSPHNRSAREFLKAGKAGKIGMVRAFVHYPGGAGYPVPDSEPPAGLDWEMWCGPAPKRPFHREMHPRGFRQFLDYANGQLGDWGIHWLDQILWWSGETAPKSVSSIGGRFIRRDNTDAPDTQVVTYQFPDFVATWEHRLYAGNEAEKHNVGCYFYGAEGTLHLGWLDGWTFYPSDTRKPILHEEAQLHMPDDQNIPELWADFLASIAANRRPVCDIEIGHRSTTMALLGMLSLKLGRSVAWNADTETIAGDAEANRLLRRAYRGPWKYPEG